ncbi:hypothetical protein ON010_g647 [Phytophthora cinnamomi]|nr:hypothetical protein ON010_g647 [Phytophthora cinnamomi]
MEHSVGWQKSHRSSSDKCHSDKRYTDAPVTRVTPTLPLARPLPTPSTPPAPSAAPTPPKTPVTPTPLLLLALKWPAVMTLAHAVLNTCLKATSSEGNSFTTSFSSGDADSARSLSSALYSFYDTSVHGAPGTRSTAVRTVCTFERPRVLTVVDEGPPAMPPQRCNAGHVSFESSMACASLQVTSMLAEAGM